MQPAIIIIAYNRSKALQRLLDSIARANYTDLGSIPLVLSVDYSSSKEVPKLCESFEWKFGEKHIIQREQHLGLKKHVIACGELIKEYGNAILLEDDLVVSPHFYLFGIKALDFYKGDSNAGGISLYRYEYAENQLLPFEPLDDEFDVHFIQAAASWGVALTDRQWRSFTNWLDANENIAANEITPSYLLEWGENSWKKHFTRYLIATNKYFVYPNCALSTNSGEKGTHADAGKLFQVPLLLQAKEWRFSPVQSSKLKYDAWFELLPESLNHFAPSLAQFDYTIDLYGTKSTRDFKSSHFLTTKVCDQQELTFGNKLFPPVQNVIAEIPGAEISLAPTSAISEKRPAKAVFFRDEGIAAKVFGDIVKTHCTIQIVIPVTSTSGHLKLSLDSISQQGYENVEVLLSIDTNLEASIMQQKQDWNYNYAIRIILDNLQNDWWSLVSKGLSACTGDVCGWIEAGSTLINGTLQEIRTVFNGQPQANWVNPVGKHSFVPMAKRLNTYLAARTLNKGEMIPSEGMFWRVHTIQQLKHTSEQSFVMALFKHEKQYPVLRKWVSSANRMVSPTSMHRYHVTPPSLSWRALAFTLRGLENRIDSHYIHDMYALLFDLPHVFRYDEENSTFGLHRY